MNVHIGFPPSSAVFSWLAVRDHYRRLAYSGQCTRTVSGRARAYRRWGAAAQRHANATESRSTRVPMRGQTFRRQP